MGGAKSFPRPELSPYGARAPVPPGIGAGKAPLPSLKAPDVVQTRAKQVAPAMGVAAVGSKGSRDCAGAHIGQLDQRIGPGIREATIPDGPVAHLATNGHRQLLTERPVAGAVDDDPGIGQAAIVVAQHLFDEEFVETPLLRSQHGGVDQRLFDHDGADTEGGRGDRAKKAVPHLIPALAEFELALVHQARGRPLDQVARQGRIVGVLKNDHGGDEHGRTAAFDPETRIATLVDIDKHDAIFTPFRPS